MTSQDDIIAALKAEKEKILSMTVAPTTPITPEDIVRDMQEQANPGKLELNYRWTNEIN